MASLSPIPSLEDLKLTINETSLVFPSQETPNKTISISNSDLLFSSENVGTAHFFKANCDFSPQDVANRLKMALGRVLVPYHFMAGRLKLSSELGRLELDCNAVGASFVVASSELSLEDDIVESIAHPNIGFKQLVVRSYDTFSSRSDQPLLFVQLTSFTCGGFAMGLCISHALMDGMGAKLFLDNLASQASHGENPLAIVPCLDRSLLRPRSPPVVIFPHREFIKRSSLPNQGSVSGEQMDYRVLKFSPTQIDQLKQQARNGCEPTARVSSFVMVTALLWQCMSFSESIVSKNVMLKPGHDQLVMNGVAPASVGSEHDKFSTLLNLINIRGRVDPPLPESYGANAVLPVAVVATREELENWPLRKVVELIIQGAEKVTDEYVKSALDWLEVHKGMPWGNHIVASWMRLGCDQVAYPWGKPMYSCPLVYDLKHNVNIFPDAMDGGILAMVPMPAHEIEIFEAQFNKLMAKHSRICSAL